jgi:hypothetical protein
VRKKEGDENIEFYIVFSKGERAMTGEAIDNKQPPYKIFLSLSFRARRLII